jgi:hypothetical protein
MSRGDQDQSLGPPADKIADYVREVSKDVVDGKITGKQAVDMIYAKSVELTGGGKTSTQVENALLVAAGGAMAAPSASNRIGEHTSLGSDTIHHVFANAFNQVEGGIFGVIVTLGAKRQEDDPRDDMANSAGFWFGVAISDRISSEGVASFAEAKGGVTVPKAPIVPSDYIGD